MVGPMIEIIVHMIDTFILNGGSSKVRSIYLSPLLSGDLCRIYKLEDET